MAFEFTKTKIPGVMIIQPKIFGDSRGYFMETFKKADYVAAGIDREFVYKCTDEYAPSSEGGIPWNDATINVEWPKLDCAYKTSEKDEKHEPFETQYFSWAEKWL